MNRRRLQQEAVLAAEYVLADLDHEPGGRIPVFELIEDRGIWLSFQPLDQLLGVYQRVGDVAGIAINAARPITLQRFTAAHELGHHELGHRSHLDDSRSIEAATTDPNELQAQTFAASLLMSELSVEAQLEHRGHDPDRPQLTALDVYCLSVELGVSYQAAVTQLRNLDKISAATAQRVYKTKPLELKQQLLGGRRPDNVRASVWRLTPADNRRRIAIDVGDELAIGLPEMRSAGYEWALHRSSGLTLVDDRYEPAASATDPQLIGGVGMRGLTLRSHRPGHTILELRLVQPWEGGEFADTFALEIMSTALPVSEIGRGISVNQHAQLLAA